MYDPHKALVSIDQYRTTIEIALKQDPFINQHIPINFFHRIQPRKKTIAKVLSENRSSSNKIINKSMFYVFKPVNHQKSFQFSTSVYLLAKYLVVV